MAFLWSFIAWLTGLFAKSAAQPPKPEPEAFNNFPFALDWVFQDEGGFVNDPNDHGGATKYGITLPTLAQWRAGRDVSVDDVKNLTKEEAEKIYRAWYWTDIGLNLIKNKAIATCIFDQAILNGQRTAINYAQMAANTCGQKIAIDGVIGPLTLSALEQVKLSQFLKAYADSVKLRFQYIVTQDPTQSRFYQGWMRRAERLLELAKL